MATPIAPVALGAPVAPVAKLKKPTPFNGTDNSLATVSAWIYRVTVYTRDTADPIRRTETASSFLEYHAETWFMAKYKNGMNIPVFNVFIQDFKKRYTRIDEQRQLLQKIETMRQGDKSVLDYANDFEQVLNMIGEDNYSLEWAKLHFEKGLEMDTRLVAAPIFLETDTIEELASKAQRVFEIRAPLRRQQTRQNSRQPATSHQARSSAIPVPAATPRGPLAKLTDIEREYLRANKGCFRCRKINAGHMAATYMS